MLSQQPLQQNPCTGPSALHTLALDINSFGELAVKYLVTVRYLFAHVDAETLPIQLWKRCEWCIVLQWAFVYSHVLHILSAVRLTTLSTFSTSDQ